MGTALSLKEANSDLDWKLIEKYCMLNLMANR